MKILLPPSETKRVGGDGAPLDVAGLSLSALAPLRDEVTEALVVLAGDTAEARRVLKLSERQAGDVDDNLTLRTAATMPAVDRYTGVLYDALDAETLDYAAREWLGEHAWIHTAPWGPIGALDLIPRYRLAARTALPGIRPLGKLWAEVTSAAIEAENPDFVLDLRSEAYVALGPVPASVPSAYVKVVTSNGAALNHFNKKSKGQLVRALAEAQPDITSQASFEQWAARNDVEVRALEPGILELITPAE